MAELPEETLQNLQQNLRKRKIYISSIVIFTVLILLVFNLGSWVFLRQMRRYLDAELGKRLVSVAALTSEMIEREIIEDLPTISENKLTLLIIQDILRRVQDKHELESAFIIDKNYWVLVDSRGDYFFNLKRTYVLEDSAIVNRAWSGESVAAPLHLVERNRFKSAYAPIHNVMGKPVGVLTLEANADFFSLLRRFRKGLVIAGVVSFATLVIFSLFLYRAIHLLIRTQESLRQSENLALMGRMAAGVAHEIRNPLGIIKGTADVLRQRYEPKDEPDELFNYIPAEVYRLNKLVNDFLFFAREKGLRLELHDINDTIKKSIAMMDGESSYAGVEVKTQLCAAPNFYYDEDAVKQVLLNLLLNSIQSFTNGGSGVTGQGRVGQITVETQISDLKKGKFLELLVKDTGSGIEGDIEKIFEPFYTTKDGGSGLGLAVSKRLIEKHGGWIEVKSQKGVGTKVKFYLPIKLKP